MFAAMFKFYGLSLEGKEYFSWFNNSGLDILHKLRLSISVRSFYSKLKTEEDKYKKRVFEKSGTNLQGSC